MAGIKIHAIAHCQECNWMVDDQCKALERARAHNRKTGHVVTAETAYEFFYEKPKTLKEETK